MSRLLLDTHTLLWWLADDPALSTLARAAIADPGNEPLVSAASVWEIAIKRSLGKLTAPEDLLERMQAEGFSWLAVESAHAWQVRALPFHHADPFDRMLIAQAIVDGLPVITADHRFRAYGIQLQW